VIVTKNSERFFLYNSIFKSVIEYDSYDHSGEFYYLTDLNTLVETLDTQPALRIEERFPILLDVRNGIIPIRTQDYNDLVTRINYHHLDEPEPFIVIHNRAVSYCNPEHVPMNLQITQEIVNGLLKFKIKMYIFSLTFFESPGVIFITDIHTYASLMNHPNCLCVISEYSGAGQLSQYTHSNEIYYYQNMYEIYSDNSAWETANEMNNMYPKFDAKLFTAGSIINCDCHHLVIKKLSKKLMKYCIRYGSDDLTIDITSEVIDKCFKNNEFVIPALDCSRAELFGDPCDGILKSIYITYPDGSRYKYSQNVSIHISDSIYTKKFVNSAIVCIAKHEKNYIIDFVKYHLALGFDSIYVYDNEDTPVYTDLLSSFKEVTVVHLPGNNYHKAIQYIALDHFISNYQFLFTHVIHIDIDEYIVLKKHTTIHDFIREYIHGDTAGIGINWRFFGSSGNIDYLDLPVPLRFIQCAEQGDPHVKTLFDTSLFSGWNTPHSIDTHKNFSVKSTNGKSFFGPHNKDIDFSVIQLNHYKSKTFPEFTFIRSRGRADLISQPEENLVEDFEKFNLNEITELTAFNFYNNFVK